MNEDQDTPRRTKRGRSPSYPGISLAEAEKRARELYNAERTHAAPITTIAEHWGYSPKSSGAKTILAALKKFGLVEDEGSGNSRQARLSDLGADLVLNPDPAQVRQQAALLPRFHRQIWDEYGTDLPSAANLRYRLIREFGFTETGADEFLEEYLETIAHAGLDDPNADSRTPDPESEISPQAEPRPRVPAAASAAGPTASASNPASPDSTDRPDGASGMTIPIPLVGEGPVYLSGAFPISGSNWDQMIRVLEAMRPGLVTPEQPAPKKNLPPTASPLREASGEADGGLHRSEYGNGDE
jgi:hypothetical protein